LDCRNGELRHNGVPLKLQPQPAKVLSVLVNRAGEVVTRQELAEQVWGSETFVDFEQGLNYAIRQIRTVLEDDADHPRFLETLPKRGYRFIAEVRKDDAPTELVPPSSTDQPIEPIAKKPRWHIWLWLTLGAGCILLLVGLALQHFK